MGIARLFTQAVDVETYLGSGAYGSQYAAPISVPCSISSKTKLVRNAAGEEIVSNTTVYAAIQAAPDAQAVDGQFSPGSRVTVAGIVTHVISTARMDFPAPVRVHHVEVYLT